MAEIEETIYLKEIITEVLKANKESIPITAIVDNRSVVEAVHSTKPVEEKHLRIDISAIKQSGPVEACWAHNPEIRGSEPRSATIDKHSNNALLLLQYRLAQPFYWHPKHTPDDVDTYIDII